MTARSQLTEMLTEQARRNEITAGYERELREQIAVLEHDLWKLNGEAPAPIDPVAARAAANEPQVPEDGPQAGGRTEADHAAQPQSKGTPEKERSIWTDSEITGSPRPVPLEAGGNDS
jgi:hypothetical protein